MKVLVVGGGGREHAIIRKLRENPEITGLYALPGNGGMDGDAVCVPVSAKDIDGIVSFAQAHAIGFAVVAPDDPLALGAVDALSAVGIPCFGPTAKAAQIESSKVFAKELMRRYHIPTATYEVFTGLEEALSYVDTCPLPTVIKADGLALGKGVVIARTRGEARSALRSMMEDKVFGDSGSRVVVEEFLEGPEVSVLSFTDGETLVPMVSSMDHKRVGDGDTGPNTGGMGAIAPNPCYTPEIAARCMEEIFLPTIRAMKAEGRIFRGCLYFGLMLTRGGPKVIEYNCRFGDPETQAVLPLLDTDLFTILRAAADGTLDQVDVRWKDAASCCVVLASAGYPGKYETGYPITLPPTGANEEIYIAGAKRDGDGTLRTAGGRVLGAAATAPTLAEAVEAAYALAGRTRFGNVYRRTDIGRRALLALKGD